MVNNTCFSNKCHSVYDDECPIDTGVNQHTISRAIRLIIYITHAMGYGYNISGPIVPMWGCMAYWLHIGAHEVLENAYYDALIWMDNNVTELPRGMHHE
jgi:hypothetical protein